MAQIIGYTFVRDRTSMVYHGSGASDLRRSCKGRTGTSRRSISLKSTKPSRSAPSPSIGELGLDPRQGQRPRRRGCLRPSHRRQRRADSYDTHSCAGRSWLGYRCGKPLHRRRRGGGDDDRKSDWTMYVISSSLARGHSIANSETPNFATVRYGLRAHRRTALVKETAAAFR